MSSLLCADCERRIHRAPAAIAKTTEHRCRECGKAARRAAGKGPSSSSGYRIIYVRSADNTHAVPRAAHRLVWEERYGAMPPGMVLHHVNGDKLDNRLENLQLVTQQDHMRIHSRLFSRSADGVWLKFCKDCGLTLPADTGFYQKRDKRMPSGVAPGAWCRRCESKRGAKKPRRSAAARHAEDRQSATGVAGGPDRLMREKP